MLMGWASGSFGLFGLTAEPVANPSLNYAGVSLAVIGLIFYLQVQPNDTRDDVDTNIEDDFRKEKGYGAVSVSVSAGIDADANAVHTIVSVNDNGESGYSPLNCQNVSNPDAEDPDADADADRDSGPYFSADSGNAAGARIRQQLLQRRGRGTEAEAGRLHKNGLFNNLSNTQRRVVGFCLALFTGLCFGCSFDPSQYVIDTEDDNIGNKEMTIVFVFPQFCGILLTSFLYTLIYSIIKIYYMKQMPYVTSEILLPGILSGVVWGIANIAWFIANQNIGFSISFPLITSGPGFVGSIWGIYKFNEIQGTKNFIFLGIAFVITVTALIMVGLSH
jgi:hypothetical protein